MVYILLTKHNCLPSHITLSNLLKKMCGPHCIEENSDFVCLEEYSALILLFRPEILSGFPGIKMRLITPNDCETSVHTFLMLKSIINHNTQEFMASESR